MPRLYDPTKARKHWVYSRDEVGQLFGVGSSTIANWLNAGLEPIDAKRPQLFAGYKLCHFVTSMRWPHGRTPENGRLYCPICQGFKAVFPETIKIEGDDTACLRLTAMCTECHQMTQATIGIHQLPDIHSASSNIPRDSSDVMSDDVSENVGKTGAPIPPESSSANLRRLYDFRIFLQDNEGFDVRTVDEYLRALARMSAFLLNKPFEQMSVRDVLNFKDHLRDRRDADGPDELSSSTILHALDRCRKFFKWLRRQPGLHIHPDLPGYFRLSRRERASEASVAKGTSLTFDQALLAFKAMPADSPIELRNRAMMALFITTGIRVAAAISLHGKHVNIRTRWINQDPREVNTKLSKHIRTYILDLDSGLLEALITWARWREANGFGDDAPFLLPDRYLEPNAIGLGYRTSDDDPPQCWKSDESVQRIIRQAFRSADLIGTGVSSHDFRKMLLPFLAKRSNMQTIEEIAFQLNLGHTPKDTTRKHYAVMLDAEREKILDELCRRALTDRSELELYLAFERNEITETDPDYRRARDIYERNSKG